ncbi:MAG: helix-turn-helix transcriptional regulator, partial [Bacteroidota bacterium]
LKHRLARSKWKAWLFTPFVLTLLINIYIDLDHEFHLTNSGIQTGTAGLNLYYEIESWLSIIYSIVVCAWTYFMLRQTSERNASNWLSRFWLWTTGVISLWVVLFLMSDMADLDFFYLLWLAISILFFWVCLRGAMQFKLAEERFEIRSIIDDQSAREKMPSEEPQKPNEDYFLQLEEMMSTNKQYRDPSLNREQVADQLGISSGYLSKLISAHTEGNFSSYVNQYRIEEVKRLLLSSEFEHYSLLAIGFEAGFNSKTTFNNTFKRLTGQTPRQFRQGAM